MKKGKKKAMTLLEVMIVIFIIGIISSVIGYNMKGSLEKAKAFKTQEGIKKIHEIFELEMAQGAASLQDILEAPENVLENSGLVSSPQEMLKDGWGKPYDIKLSRKGDLVITSETYKSYKNKQKKKPTEVAFTEEEGEVEN